MKDVLPPQCYFVLVISFFYYEVLSPPDRATTHLLTLLVCAHAVVCLRMFSGSRIDHRTPIYRDITMTSTRSLIQQLARLFGDEVRYGLNPLLL